VLIDGETGEFVEFNERALDNLGFSREKFEKLKIPDFEVVESAEEVAKHIKKIIKKGSDSFETKHRTKSGEIRDIQVSSRAISIRGKNFIQSIWRDITDCKRAQDELRKAHEQLKKRVEECTTELSKGNEQLKQEIAEHKRAEEALRQSETRYRTLFEGSPVSLWEADYSEANKIFDSLRGSGVNDFRTYFEHRPGAVAHIAHLVKITDVNRATLDLYEAKGKAEFMAGLRRIFTKESLDGHKETIIALAEGQTTHETETLTQTLTGDKKYIVVRLSVVPGYESSLSKVSVSVVDVTKPKRAQEVLQKREAALEARTSELEEVNNALSILLKRIEEDKRELEEKTLLNVKQLVLPYVEKIKKYGLDAKQMAYLRIFESNLKEIISPFAHELSSKHFSLSPTEIQVAHLVKDGSTTKEIAELLNVCSTTVEAHRKKIRKKVGIKNKKANLRSYLLSV